MKKPILSSVKSFNFLKKIFLLIIFAVLSSSLFGQTTLVRWDFPNDPDNATADGGIAANLTKTLSTVGGTSAIGYGNNGATTNSATATGWNNGSGNKYWYIDIVTTGYASITVSSAQRGRTGGGNNAPRDYRLEYNIGAGWNVVAGGTITVADNWTSGVLTNIALPAECNNVASLQLRWIMTSNTRIGGGTVGAGDNNRIDDIIVRGNQIVTYYSQGSLDPNLRTSWNTIRGGGGAQPPALNTFTTNYQVFVIQNTHTMTTTSGWNISGTYTKLQIENGGTLQANNAVTLSAATTFQIDNGGTYIHNNTGTLGTTIFQGTESFGASSNFEIRQWQTITTSLTANLTASIVSGGNNYYYGNLIFNYTGLAGAFSPALSGTTYLCAGNLNIQSTGSSLFRLSTAATAFNLFVLGNYSQSSGTVVDFNSSATAGVVCNLNLGGNLTLSGTATLNNSGTGYAGISYINASATQTVDVSATANMAKTIWTVGTGASTNTVQLINDINDATNRRVAQLTINSSSIFNMNGRTLMMAGHTASSLTVTGTLNATTANSKIIFNNSGTSTTSISGIGTINGNELTLEYNHSGTGANTFNRNVPVKNFTITAGTVNLNGYILGVSSVYTNSGTITANALNSTIELNGTALTQSFNIGTYTGNEVYNFIANNPFGVTLTNNLNVNSKLILNSGIVTVNPTYVLKINSSAGQIQNYGATRYIDGSLSRLMTNGTTYSFPVGNSVCGYHQLVFSNINVTANEEMKVTFSCSGALTGDASIISPLPIAINWHLENVSGTFTDASIQLDGTEIDFSNTIAKSALQAGTYTLAPSVPAIGTITATSLGAIPTDIWLAIATPNNTTFYSYQTGKWNVPTTWTLDPSGTLQVGSTIPGNNSIVYILGGRTVTLPSDIASTNLTININSGATLDDTIYTFTSPLKELNGQGTLKIKSTNFPTSLINTFVNAGGGTTEYYNSSDFTMPSQAIYNNLIINTSVGVIATQLNDITLNGNMRIKAGTFRINNDISSVKLALTIHGNTIVDAGAFITVGKGATNSTTDPTSATLNAGSAPYYNYYEQFHSIKLYGNFTNDGNVKFTNLSYPIFNLLPPTTSGATTGAATVYFLGNTNNTLYCNGTTDFYNFILDKGTDQTYKLIINSTAYPNFRLFGANIATADGTLSDPFIKKALWIRSGTLELQGSCVIPSLTEGNTGTTTSSDYFLPSKAALILNGSSAIVLVTADDYREINVSYGVAAPNNGSMGIILGGNSALKLYGKLQVNSGYLSTRESGGIITDNSGAGIGSGQFILNGGTVDTKQILGSTQSNASYTQTGGTLLVRGRFTRLLTTITTINHIKANSINTARAINGINANYGSFSLSNSSNIFSISAGTITIYDICGDGTTTALQKAFDVLSTTANINVTGGTIEFRSNLGSVLPQSPFLLITTKASLGNVLVQRAGGTSVVRLNTYPLTVMNNMNIAAGVFDANNLNLTIGGNFTIASGTTYTTGTNTTVLNGSLTQTFTVNLAAALNLNKFTIDKAAGSIVNFAGTQTIINVNDDFRLVLGTLNDNGNTINCLRNIYNSGLHTGTGKIIMNGTTTQTIDGNGIFNNLNLFNTNADAAPISLIANTTINGALTLSNNKLFNINTYNLKLNSDATIVNSGPLRYIQTSGNSGDGGLTKAYSTTTPSFIFPIGAPTLLPTAQPVKYTPVTIGFSNNPTTYGSITIIPVGYEHPATTINGQSLTYFWRLKSSGFAGIPANSVTHSFVYNDIDVPGIETNYVPSYYNPLSHSWNNGLATNINTTTNTITDWNSPTNSTAFLDGDYTAGDNAFGTPQIYYSRQSGPWSTLSTWSLTSHTVDNPPLTAPDLNDIVIIGGNDVVNLTDTANCASLQIEVGSTLDIYTWTGSTFGMVLNHPNGNGLFRLTTTVTPSGVPKLFSFPSNSDFTDFNNNFGTTEYYDIDGLAGALYILPANVTEYGNLILTAMGGDNLVLPNNSLTTIKGNLTCGGDNPNAWIAVSWNTQIDPYFSNIYDPTVEKTVHITGNLNVNTGTFIFMPELVPQHIIVDGNVTVGTNGYIEVQPSVYGTPTGLPVANTFIIGGNLTNNSTANPFVRFLNSNYYCDVTFQGSTNASISGSGNTVFNKVTINKGTSPITTLTCDIGGDLSTPTDNWLTIQNGTFKYLRTNPSSDFTISTLSPFTIPSTAGLYVNYSNSGNRNILIANSAVNTNDLFLDGKLTLISGNIYVGPINGITNNNNDIEYSGGGFSEIEIQGGILFVNGQIRRSTSSTNGSLKYTQSGGKLIINGQNSDLTRAKLEILNPGSIFNMSGGKISIVRGNGTTFGDLYLRPASSVVTAGTILFSQTPDTIWTVVDLDQSYILDANTPLYNLTISGKTAATPRNAVVDISVNPLILKGTLTLSNANSTLNSNNLNVTIGGDMNNSGTYSYGTNLTTFNGNVQKVSGASTSNFYDLNVSPVTSLTINKTLTSFTINSNLTVGNGTLILANNKAIVKGDLINNANYTDDNTSGVCLMGTALQQISGYGSFGKLELNNFFGAIINNDVTIQNDLALTQGNLTIGSYQLSLGLNSLIKGAPFSATKMIISDGVISSQGVRKFFSPIAGLTTFDFPVGIASKYTPASYSITSSATVGYINVNPINSNHSSVLDPSNVLKYYWNISSSGITNFNGTLLLKYLPTDVQGGPESNYVAAWLENPGITWEKALPGAATDNVNETTHTITFVSSGSNNLSGAYTAGNDLAIPGEVPTYQSNQDGDWTNNLIWDPVGTLIPCPVGGPNGYNVIINHVVTANANYCNAITTTINNKLKIIAAFPIGHNMGIVTGNGTLYLEVGNLPAGNFNSFLDCANNATLEYGGTGTYEIIASQFSSLSNLFFSGTGTRILPNIDLTICKRMVINSPTTVDQSVNNRKLIILGTLERYGSGVFKRGNGANATVSFAGLTPQTLAENFTGASGFNNLEINNSAGLTIGAGQVNVMGTLLLTNGLINTSTTNKLFLNSTTNIFPSSGSTTSYINGPLIKYMTAGTTFNFPLGKGNIKAHDLNISASSLAYWTGEFFTPNATYNSFSSPLQITNKLEYWKIDLYTTASANGSVKIAWDPQSDLTPLMTQNGLSDMCVADYNTGTNQWDSLTSIPTGDVYNGNVETYDDQAFVLGTPINYTIGSLTTVRPMASLDVAAGYICGLGGIPVKFTTYSPISLNYTLTYTINGGLPNTVTVSSLPYVLPTLVQGIYKLTGFTYNNGAGIGAVSNSEVNVIEQPNAAFAGNDQAICGVSGTALEGNLPVAPSSGLWTVVSGLGGVIMTPTANDSKFIGILGRTYTLRWTISNGTCSTSDDVVISFPIAADRPSAITVPSSVCQGSTGNVFSVTNVVGNTYNWSYSGTGAIINGIGNPITGAGNSVSIDFSTTATNGTLTVTASNICGTSLPSVKSINLNPVPTVSLTGNDFVCQGSSVTYTASSGLGPVVTDYEFFVNGLSVLNIPNNNTYTTSSLVNGDIITVTGTTALGCYATSPGITVTVNSTGTWWGNTSTNWFDNSNWACGIIPTNVIDVTIPSGAPNMPDINAGGAVCRNITINDGATLTLSGSNNLNVYGNWINNNLLANQFIFGTGSITFKGASASQTITTAVATGEVFYNLNIEKTAGTIDLTGTDVTINGNLKLSQGIINTGASRIIISDGAGATSSSDLSYINGICRKIGSTPFEFPIGKGYWAPAAIDASLVSNTIDAEFFNSGCSNNTLPEMNGGLNHVSYLEHWDITRISGTDYPAITLFWKDNIRSGINNTLNLKVAHWNGALWDNMGGIVSGSLASGSIKSSVAFAGYSPISFGSLDNSAPLPIDLLNNYLICDKNKIIINWSTATETNNDFFTIERSGDGTSFYPIFTIKGAGNSNTIKNYSVIDSDPIFGTSFYRLKQTDFDGKFKYFPVKSTNCLQYISEEPTLIIYPNPFDDLIYFEANNLNNNSFLIQITDELGNIIETKEMKNLQDNKISFNFNLSKCIVGVYYYKFISGNFIKTGKILKK